MSYTVIRMFVLQISPYRHAKKMILLELHADSIERKRNILFFVVSLLILKKNVSLANIRDK